MEFFAIADVTTTPESLQALTVQNLPEYCADIEKLIHSIDKDNAVIYCVWGEFTVQRQLINGGVRFSLPGCPNALAWTMTTGFEPAPDKVVIHCTINRTAHDPDFIDSIEAFINSCKMGLEAGFSTNMKVSSLSLV